MGFWIFMSIMILLIPVTMIIFGAYFIKKAPKEINYIFGYRTSMSMKNKETWIFAHTYIGRLWLIVGLIMLSVSVIIMLFFINEEITAVGIAGGVVTLAQCVFMILPILPVEIALKKNFNKDGSRKK